MQIAHDRRDDTFQLLWPTTRLMLVSMLPVIANTLLGKYCDNILAAWRVGKVWPEWEMHSATVCCLSRATPNLHSGRCCAAHTMTSFDHSKREALAFGRGMTQFVAACLRDLPVCISIRKMTYSGNAVAGWMPSNLRSLKCEGKRHTKGNTYWFTTGVLCAMLFVILKHGFETDSKQKTLHR